MELEQRKIFTNTKFDLEIVKLVIKKNWYWCLIFFVMLLTGTYLFLRYTKPIYESKILIQINSENQGADALDFKDIRQGINKNSLSKEIEMLRSRMLFKRAINDLPLEVSHHAKGDFLTETKYKNNNFEVRPLLLKDTSIYNIPIYICADGDEVTIDFDAKGETYSFRMSTNDILVTPLFDVHVKIKNWENFINDCQKNKLYFQFNDLNAIAKEFYSGLNIHPIDYDARTVEISYRSHNSHLAQDIVSSVANNFFKYYEEIKKESAENILEFINQQLDSLTSELSMSKDSIMNFRRKENINDLEYLSTSITNTMLKLKEEEVLIHDEIEILSALKQKLNNQSKSIDIYRLIPTIIGQTYENSLNEQIRGLYDLIEQKENLSFKVTGDNEAIKRLEDRIELRIGIINDIIESLFERSNEKLTIVKEKIKEEEARYSQVPEKQMELSRLLDIQSLNEKYYAMLSEKKVMYSISNAGYSSDNKILDEASISSKPVFPQKSMFYGLAILLGIMFSSGFLALRYLTFNKINQPSDLKAVVPSLVGFLGSVPYRETNSENSMMIVNKFPKSSISEAFRTLRINLSFISKDVQTVSITSTISQEGKTFIALNLGGVIAMSGKRVIIADLDMRRPKIHLGFNGNNHKGMSNLLAGHFTLDEVIQKTDLGNLDYIAAGPVPPNPSELLLKPEFGRLMEELKGKYDMIIFDNPPIGIVSDGIPVLQKVDVPIYVFRANYSKRYFVDSLAEIIRMKKLNNLNIVLNGVEHSKRSYRRKYNYGYYVEE